MVSPIIGTWACVQKHFTFSIFIVFLPSIATWPPIIDPFGSITSRILVTMEGVESGGVFFPKDYSSNFLKIQGFETNQLLPSRGYFSV